MNGCKNYHLYASNDVSYFIYFFNAFDVLYFSASPVKTRPHSKDENRKTGGSEETTEQSKKFITGKIQMGAKA